MRRHAAFFRLGTTTTEEEDADPNDDLWALHRKYNRVASSPEPKMPSGPGFCVKAKQVVTGRLQSMATLQLTGRTTIAVIGLMFLIRFTVLENPVETFSRVVSEERKADVKTLMVSLRGRFGVSGSGGDSPLGLTRPQLDAYTLASNLSASYDAMIMSSMWHGWRRMALAMRGMPARTFQATVDAALRTWAELMESLDATDLAAQTSGSRPVVCPDSLSSMSGSGLEAKMEGGVMVYDVSIPCGVQHDSTVTILGKPIKNFYVQLMTDTTRGSSSVVYRFEVVFHGDAAPFLLQSQPYAFVRSEEPYTERSPASTRQRFLPDGKPWPTPPTAFVDSFHPCSEALSKPRIITPKEELESEDILVGHFPGFNVLDESWFPFAEDQPFVLTITFGLQGYHIRVDGNYVCSFLYNQTSSVLESISTVRIGGDVLAISVMANGLPMPKKTIPIPDHLKAPSTALDDEKVEMLIGVISGSIQFERRMGFRRTWAQYPEIRSGRVLLRFFVGLTRTKNMNRRIFKEANLFKDVVILPFVDEPNYTVLKTVAMCRFMIKHTQSPYLLKTEHDTFVRVDTVLPAVVTSETTRGLLYASMEEKGTTLVKLPKISRGPGYAISRDGAAFITRQYEDKRLELFRVESVAMGNWVDLYQRQYLHRVNYIDDAAFLNKGCASGYTIAHGQNLQQMLCLWKRLQNLDGPLCCNNLVAATEDLKEATVQGTGS